MPGHDSGIRCHPPDFFISICAGMTRVRREGYNRTKGERQDICLNHREGFLSKESMVSTAETYVQEIRPDAVQDRKASMISIIFAGSIGTIIEWYDFLIYGTAAALVFNTLFFPTFDPATGILASLGTYAVGFFARPLGAALFGHYGDRV